jgi:hypothetical protein
VRVLPRITLLVLMGSLTACGSSSPTAPSMLFTISGTGNTVFTMPDSVTTVRIVGTFTSGSSNFIVWIGPAGSACSASAGVNCRLLVNVIIGTSSLASSATYDGTVQTGGGTVSILNSTDVSWSFTEVR